jgi:small-conductance mechanosensitive channel
MDLTAEPWFPWALGLILVVPVLVLALAELHLRLVRRGSPLATPVNRLRTWLVPLAALLVLLTLAADLSRDNPGVQVVATLVGTITVAVALGALDAVLFGNARRGTWRERLPSIFVDLARLLLVVTGAAVVASFVWGLDVGGWFAALGVGSIVIGLALQNAIGSVVSGLLLLFEQPFTIGDTLDVGGVQGRVTEMNWRSTHLDTGVGIQIIPNATIAAASFTNLARPTPAHDHLVRTTFATSDDPRNVMDTLLAVAGSLPSLRTGVRPSVLLESGATYVVRLPLVTAAQTADAESQFRTWLWYAARREGLDLDGGGTTAPDDAVRDAAVHLGARSLAVGSADVELMRSETTLLTYGAGEVIHPAAVAPPWLGIVVRGRVRLAVLEGAGSSRGVDDIDPGELVGETTGTRQAAPLEARALTTVDVLVVPLATLQTLLLHSGETARRLHTLQTQRAVLAAPAGQPGDRR